MKEFLYRFRSIDSALGKHEELERQEIFFSSPGHLNDPLEGHSEIFWDGDEIVWRNLLKHYLLCLDHVASWAMLHNAGDEISAFDIYVRRTEDDLPTQQYKDLFKEVCADFFDSWAVSKLPRLLSSRKSPVYQNELLLYLQMLHPAALVSLWRIYARHGLVDKPLNLGARAAMVRSLPLLAALMDKMARKLSNIENAGEVAANIFSKVSEEQTLIRQFQLRNELLDLRKEIVLLFPQTYVRRLKEMTRPGWYVACFSENCENPLLWSHYADGHRGICLKFRVVPGNECLGMRLSGPRGSHNYSFHRVDYSGAHPATDFFRSLGRIPMRSLMDFWYLNDRGDISRCADGVLRDHKMWRGQYWNTFYSCVTTKQESWSYEEEYRLVSDDMLMTPSDESHQKLKYDFRDLDGIIFGASATTNDKLQIMKIVDKKCNAVGRRDFNFYQASYSNSGSELQISKLSLSRSNS